MGCNSVKYMFIFLLSKAVSNGSPNSCVFNVKVHQILHNEGFHRNLTYEIEFDTAAKDTRLYRECLVGIEQVLPPGVFANPDELGDLRRMAKITAIPKNKINVELPAEQSSRSSVFLIRRLVDTHVHLWLPVHARYHQAVSGGGTASNEIGPPKLYIRCSNQALDECDKVLSPTITFLCDGHSKDKCTWRSLPLTMMTDTLIWRVPVGNTDDYYIVSIGTTLVVVLGSLYLLKTIHNYKIGLNKKIT